METIFFILVNCGVFAYLIKIEHRLTKIETSCKNCIKHED